VNKFVGRLPLRLIRLIQGFSAGIVSRASELAGSNAPKEVSSNRLR
jgi:hypothetical protein